MTRALLGVAALFALILFVGAVLIGVSGEPTCGTGFLCEASWINLEGLAR
jgi:hypothetical protein